MHYGVLGPIEARDGDGPVRIGGPQQQRMLGLLLTQPGQVVEAARMVEALWPDGLAPDGSAHSVLTYVHRLRSALGHPVASNLPQRPILVLAEAFGVREGLGLGEGRNVLASVQVDQDIPNLVVVGHAASLPIANAVRQRGSAVVSAPRR